MVNTRSKGSPCGSNTHDEDESRNSNALEFDLDESMESITLEMIYHQLKLHRSDLFNKIDNVKEDILIQIQNENLMLRNEISELRNNLEQKNKEIRSIKSDLDIFKAKLGSMVSSSELVKVERDLSEAQQYIRRNNVEICGIPESVEDQDLENCIIKLADAVDLKINSPDIEACHRLKKRKNQNGPRRVIVRFSNRKNCESLLRSSKQFKKPSVLQKADLKDFIYINNNLSGYNKFLWGKAKSLKQKNLIHKFWSFNGVLNVLLDENSNVRKITHITDLISMSPDNELWQSALK